MELLDGPSAKKDLLAYHASLEGQPGSRYRLITPALILDLDAFERNNRRLIDFLSLHGMTLRANAKTHKSVEVARRQIAAGAAGVCCATPGEALAMLHGGIGSVLMTTPLTVAAKVDLLLAAAGGAELITVVDHPAQVDVYEQCAQRRRSRLQVLVDVDAGSRRTGVASEEAAIELAMGVAGRESLVFRGLQFYAGGVQHICDAEARRRDTLKGLAYLRGIVDRLYAAELRCDIVSGGGTGSYAFDAPAGILTESQAGSFAFMDVDYLDVWQKDGRPPPFEAALFVQTCVHSASHRGFVTTDAGSKRFGTDGSMPRVTGEIGGAMEYRFHGDEHGKIFLADTALPLAVGDRVECVVPHCDPTINLYPWLNCVRGDTLVETWRIDARGI